MLDSNEFVPIMLPDSEKDLKDNSNPVQKMVCDIKFRDVEINFHTEVDLVTVKSVIREVARYAR